MKLDTISRRHLVAAALLAAAPDVAVRPASAALSRLAPLEDGRVRGVAATRLLSLIPSMPFGAPATNATLSAELVAQIEASAAELERSAGADLVRDRKLNGSWRLLYSDGREITSLARGFPGGFGLGPTYQPIDIATGRFENQGSVVNRYGIARLSTTVVGDVNPAPTNSLNAAGVRNDRGNRVDVNFRRITFSLDEVFGRPTKLRKVLKPNLQAGVEQPANDVTYLDASIRITRGGDGALFIFRREESDRPLLSVQEREVLYNDDGAIDVTTGSGRAEDSAPPELKRLLREDFD